MAKDCTRSIHTIYKPIFFTSNLHGLKKIVPAANKTYLLLCGLHFQKSDMSNTGNSVHFKLLLNFLT